MDISYIVIHPLGELEHKTASLSDSPSYAEIRSVVDPILGGNTYYQVAPAVLDGVAWQLLCDEDAGLQDRPVNTLATELFQAARRLEDPEKDPSMMYEIQGTVVLLPQNTCTNSQPLASLGMHCQSTWPKGAWSIVGLGLHFVVEKYEGTESHRRVYRDGRIEPCDAPIEEPIQVTVPALRAAGPRLETVNDDQPSSMRAVVTISRLARGGEHVMMLGYGANEQAARIAAYSWINRGRNDFDEEYDGGQLFPVSARLAALFQLEGTWEDIYSESGEKTGRQATDLHHDLLNVLRNLCITERGELCSPMLANVKQPSNA